MTSLLIGVQTLVCSKGVQTLRLACGKASLFFRKVGIGLKQGVFPNESHRPIL
jgi:hypothetical protein